MDANSGSSSKYFSPVMTLSLLQINYPSFLDPNFYPLLLMQFLKNPIPSLRKKGVPTMLEQLQLVTFSFSYTGCVFLLRNTFVQ